MLKSFTYMVLGIAVTCTLPSAVQAGYVRIDGSGFSIRLGTPSYNYVVVPQPQIPTVTVPHTPQVSVVPVYPNPPVVHNLRRTYYYYPPAVKIPCPNTPSVLITPQGTVINVPPVVIQNSNSSTGLYYYPYTSF